MMKRLILLIALCPVLAVLIAASNPQYTVPQATGGAFTTTCVTPFSDTFPGSGPLSSCWTNVPISGYVACAQAIGHAQSSGGASSSCMAIVGGGLTFSATSQQAQVTWTRASGAPILGGVVVNMTTAGTGAVVLEGGAGGAAYVQEYVAGAFSHNICTAAPPNNGETIKLAVSGTTYTLTNVTTSTTMCTGTQTGLSGNPGIIGANGSSGQIGSLTNFTAQ
jgi:hypothetical protein